MFLAEKFSVVLVMFNSLPLSLPPSLPPSLPLSLSLTQASYADSPFQYACIGKMIDDYKWLFQVDEEEEAREKVKLNLIVRI